MNSNREALTVRAATEAEIPQALAQLLAGFAADEQAGVVAVLYKALADGSFHRDFLRVAARGGDIVGAAALQLIPGGTAVVWPPQRGPEETLEVESALLADIHEIADRRGAILCQSLVPEHDLRSLHALRSAGYEDHGPLQYLIASNDMFPEREPATVGFRLLPFEESQEVRLRAVVEGSYVESLDFPSLGNPRPIEMVLTGYRNTGTYAPENWFLAVEGERDIGCLLLSEHAGAIWEIVYMALVPEARGRGMGKSLVRFAQWHAGRLGAGSLVLAVDERNLPALRGYEDCGFILLERRRLLTKRLRSRHETD